MKKIRNILVIGAFLSVFIFAPMANADTTSDLQDQISSLLEMIATLQAQLQTQQTTGTVVPPVSPPPSDQGWCHTFATNLGWGNEGSEVEALQVALEKEGFYIGPDKGYFGSVTLKAVKRFQEKYASEILAPVDLTVGNGYVGASTRAKLNGLYVCGTEEIDDEEKLCIQVITPARNWETGECKNFPSPCDVPNTGKWDLVESCSVATPFKSPDLVIDGPITVEKGVAGDQVSYFYEVYVKNIGNAPARKSEIKTTITPKQPQIIGDGSSFYWYSFSKNPIPMNDLVSGDYLNSGQREHYREYFNPYQAGTITITAEADIDNVVIESNEVNNKKTQSFYVDKLYDLPSSSSENNLIPISAGFESGNNEGWMYGNAAKGVVTSERAHNGNKSNKITFASGQIYGSNYYRFSGASLPNGSYTLKVWAYLPSVNGPGGVQLWSLNNAKTFYDISYPSERIVGKYVGTKDQWVQLSIPVKVTTNSSQDDTYILMQGYGDGGNVYYVDDWELTKDGGTTLPPPPKGSISVTMGSTPVAQNIVAGGGQVPFATYKVTAGDAENIKITSMQLKYSGTGSPTGLTDCGLHLGVLYITGVAINPVSFGNHIFSIDPINIKKGESRTFTLKCNVPASVTTGSYSWGITSDAKINATGLSSGYSVASTINAGNGNTMTVASGGALTVGLDSLSPASAVVSGSTNITVAKLRFYASDENIDLKKVVLQFNGSNKNAISKYTLWDGSTKIGEGIFFPGANNTSTSTLVSSFVVPANRSKVLTIKVDFSPLASNGDTVVLGYDGDDWSGTYGVGQSSGSTIKSSTKYDVMGYTFTLSGAILTPLIQPLPTSNLISGFNDFYRASFRADGGDIKVNSVRFKNMSSGLGSYPLGSMTLDIFADSNYSYLIKSTPGSSSMDGVNFYPGVTIPSGQTYYINMSGALNTQNLSGDAVARFNIDSASDIIMDDISGAAVSLSVPFPLYGGVLRGTFTPPPVVVPPPPATNHFPVTVDFEGGSNSGWEYGNGASGVVSTERAHGGSYSNKITFNESQIYGSNWYRFGGSSLANGSYTLKVWAYIPSNNGPSGVQLWSIDNALVFYNFSSPAERTVGSYVGSPKDQWVQLSLPFTVTSNSSQDDTYILMQAYGNGGNVYYVDDWELVESAIGSIPQTSQMANVLDAAKGVLLRALDSIRN